MKNELTLPTPNAFATRDEFATGAFLLIDKPLGWTSFDVLNRIKAYVRNNMPALPPNEHGHDQRFKIGHAGTLDPLATGLLTICTGKYTKLIDDIQAGEKVYTGSIILGYTTPTYDLETEPEHPLSIDHVTPELIESTRLSFVGETWQRPPVYSAKQVDGKRAYMAARKGQDIIIPAVPIFVNDFKINQVSANQLDFEINCAKGTYIRSIAHDFGQKLRTGAYLASLRRVSSKPFHVDQSTTLEALLARLESMG
jgi:tRNA pseudouridine55 synthase